MNDSGLKTSVHEFSFEDGLIGRKRKLVITPEYIDLDGTRIGQNMFVDVKYLSEHIVWYKFYVGVRFRIEIKSADNHVLVLKFSRYAWKNRHYGHVYTEISRWIGHYFLLGKINRNLECIEEKGMLELCGLLLTRLDVTIDKTSSPINWANMGLQEYPSYFVIFDKNNPAHHKRVTFDEWESEILFNTLKSFTHTEKENNK